MSDHGVGVIYSAAWLILIFCGVFMAQGFGRKQKLLAGAVL